MNNKLKFLMLSLCLTLCYSSNINAIEDNSDSEDYSYSENTDPTFFPQHTNIINRLNNALSEDNISRLSHTVTQTAQGYDHSGNNNFVMPHNVTMVTNIMEMLRYQFRELFEIVRNSNEHNNNRLHQLKNFIIFNIGVLLNTYNAPEDICNEILEAINSI